MQDIIKDMRTRCRLAMNGVASTSMRQRGLTYKVNFGLNIQQIKDLSSRYQPDAALAATLWKEDTRELKILATLLYPVKDFNEEMANSWVTEIPNQEIREQVCLNLFQNLSYANQLALAWANSENENIRTTGYWLLTRLFLTKSANTVSTNVFSFILEDAVSNNTFIRNAALLALKQIGRQSREQANWILNKLSIYKVDANLINQEAYNSLNFEFEYYFEE